MSAPKNRCNESCVYFTYITINFVIIIARNMIHISEMLRSPDNFTSFVKTDSRSNETDDKRSEWIIDNTYNLEAFGQINGEWKDKHPLPLPVWADKTYVAHNFDGVSFDL